MRKKIVCQLFVMGSVMLSVVCHGQVPIPTPTNMERMRPVGLNGTVKEFPNFVLSGSSAKWLSSDPKMLFVTGGNYYQLVISSTYPLNPYLAQISKEGPVVQANRNYTVHALVFYSLPQSDSEIDMGVRTITGTANTITPPSEIIRSYNNSNIVRQDVNGVMYSSGTTVSNPNAKWEWWSYSFTSLPIDGGKALFQIVPRFRGERSDGVFAIADAFLVEHDALIPQPYAQNTGGQYSGTNGFFTGTTGLMGMEVKAVYPNQSGSTAIKVETTGCMFTIDKTTNTVSMRNLIGTGSATYRANVKSSLSMAGMTVQTATNNKVICVMSNTNMTITIQPDSLMTIVPHQAMDLTVKGRTATSWNRFFKGHLLSVEDKTVTTAHGVGSYAVAGFTVNPAIQPGTGEKIQVVATSTAANFMDTYNQVNVETPAAANWEIKYTMPPGQRLGVSSFPPRPYDWDKSFKSTYAVAGSTAGLATLAAKDVNYVVMFETFFEGGWAAGGETADKYRIIGDDLPNVEDTKLKKFINAIKSYKDGSGNNKMKAVLYTSPRFYHNDDMKVFIAEIKRIRDKYGIDGIYYDGTPYDWISTYELMRMTRELFPNGPVILHSSIAAPSYMPDIICPFIETYADVTLKAETVDWIGLNAAYSRNIVSQYGLANNVGVVKADRWVHDVVDQHLDTPVDFPGSDDTSMQKEAEAVHETAAFLKCLQYGGRGRRSLGPLKFDAIYKTAVLDNLKTEWDNHQNDANFHATFFETYYLPRAIELTKGYLDGF